MAAMPLVLQPGTGSGEKSSSPPRSFYSQKAGVERPSPNCVKPLNSGGFFMRLSVNLDKSYRYIMIYAVALLVCSVASHDVPDGSLLFVEGGNETVMNHCNSPYSHVAVIFNIDGEPWIYEAVKPVVRKIKLSDYVREIEEENKDKKKLMKLWVRKPKVRFNTSFMRKYSENMLGTKYSVNSYISGNPQKNKIHCGELTARTLMTTEKIKVHGNPCKKTPQGIMNLCRPYYRKARML